MMDKVSQRSSVLSNQFALIEVALEMYYGGLELLLSQTDITNDKLADKLNELKQLIERLREQAKKIEIVAQKMENLLPKIMDAIGSDKGAGCPHSDPRLVEFFRLWNQPLVITADWQRLAKRFSQAEKSAFARRLTLRAHHSGLYGHRILELQSQSRYKFHP